MIKVEFSGETSADVHALIKSFAVSPNTTGTNAAGGASDKKPDAADAKKEIADEEIRAKLKASELPIEEAKALVKKFGYEAVTKIPVKKRAEFMTLIDTIMDMSVKKRKEYLAEEEPEL